MDRLINPDMLILARESRGMTQTELADALSVTQGKISKYENGMLLVSDDDLERLTKVLNYTAEFFFQKDQVYGLGSSFLFHRQRKDVPVLLQKKIQAQVNILRVQVERLLRGAEIAAGNQFEPLDIDAYNGKAERVAAVVRASWKVPLGPFPNVTAAVEAAGGIVLTCSFETRLIDAAHLWLPGLPPLFFLNKDLPGDRLRWTLAHECGHAFMHHNPTSEDVEEQANRFASELLMPADEIAHQLDNLTIERAAILKQHWKVSMAAIIKRAQDLERITARKAKSLFSHMGALGYRLNEPFPIPVEEPKVVRQLVAFHRQELGYNDFDLARLLLYSPDPQFFARGHAPTILKMNGEPFFAFFTEIKPRLFTKKGDGTG
jgi:Zn-dependent peptidase ImmA (M78 family)/transcriptional regulator with XRE-family HTH domain